MASRTLLQPGISNLRRLLQDELPSLRQAPVLVIASGPPGDGNDSSPQHNNNVTAEGAKNISEACKFVQFTLAQQMGLRTVPSTISSAFPTLHDLDERKELLRRTGASSIVSVGSGAAIDLGKALSDNVEQTILVPATPPGILASGTSNSLILDSSDEETLVPEPKTSSSLSPISICPLDADKYMTTIDNDLVIKSALAIALDACYRGSNHPVLEGLLKDIENILVAAADGSSIIDLSAESAMQILYQSGQLVSFGLEKEDRSSPLTLASSLIPRIFPHVPIMTFYASLLPGIYHLLSTKQNTTTSQNGVVLSPKIRDRIAKLNMISYLTVEDKSLEGFSIPDMALSHIHSNQNVWKSFDLHDNELMDILKESVTVMSAH